MSITNILILFIGIGLAIMIGGMIAMKRGKK